MISRGLQMYFSGELRIGDEERIPFNQVIQSWTTHQLPEIESSSGTFTISEASLSDYLIVWQISLKGGINPWWLCTNFRFDSDYDSFDYEAGGSYSNPMYTCSLQGTRLIHMKTKSKKDVLTFSIVNNCFSGTSYLTTPTLPLPSSIDEHILANASISIISI